MLHWCGEIPDYCSDNYKEALMVADRVRDELLTYDEAASILGIQRDSVKQLVSRGHLHSVPAPEDRRRRRVLRTEVVNYALDHAGKWSYAESTARRPARSDLNAQADVPLALAEAGVAGAAAALGLIAALRKGSDATVQLLIIGALVAIALLLFLEWQRQGKLDAAQRKRLEKLAKRAEGGESSEEFVEEFERLLLTA
jgi:excisionase family DNA binding protein